MNQEDEILKTQYLDCLEELKKTKLELAGFKAQEVYMSDKVINDIVDTLLKNPNINIKYMPDVFERKIYVNVLKMMLGITCDVLKSTKINILGHSIVPSMAPTENGEK